MKRISRTWLRIVLLMTSLSSTPLMAQGSMDSIYRTQVIGNDGTPIVVARNPFDPLAYHYIPTSIRVVVKDGMPMINWREWNEGGEQHGILQAALTGALLADEEKRVRKAAVEQFKVLHAKDPSVVIPTPEQIKLNSVGTLTDSRVQALLVSNGGVRMVLDGAAAPQPNAKEVNGSLTGAAVTQGATELSGQTWVQLSVDGTGVQVVRELLKGEGRGGIIFALSAKHAAWQPESHIDIKMNVTAVQKFFRDRVERRKGWAFLFLGEGSHSVTDHIKTVEELHSNIQISAVNAGMEQAELSKIQERIHAWITNQVFTSKDPSVPTDSTSTDPIRFFDAGPAIGSLIGMPLGALPVGWGSNSSELHVAVESDKERTAEAHWHGFQLEQVPFMMYGAVGLQGYDKSIVDKIITPPIDIKPVAGPTVILPVALEGSPIRNAIVTGTRLDSHGRATQFASAYFNAEQQKWTAMDKTDTSRNFSGNLLGFRVAVAEQYDPTGTFAELIYQLPRANHIALPSVVVRKQADSSGRIVFSESDLPVHRLCISSSTFEDPLVQFEKLRLGFQLTFDGSELGWTQKPKIVVPSLTSTEKAYEFEAAGKLVNVQPKVDVIYHDVMSGRTHLDSSSDLERLRAHVLQSLSTGMDVAIDTTHLGIKVYGLSLRALTNSELLEVRGKLIAETGESASFDLKRSDDGTWIDLATGRVLTDSTLWLPTTRTIRSLEVKAVSKSRQVTELEIPSEFSNWVKNDRSILVLR